MVTLKCCPHCGSFDYTYTGIDYGGGDYGSALCDQYECETCGYYWEERCTEYDDDDDDDRQTLDLTNTDSIEPDDDTDARHSVLRNSDDDIPW